MLFVAGLVLLFPVSGLLLAEDMVMFWILGACGLLVLPALVPAAQWHGTNQIAIDRKSVVVTRGPFWTRLPPLATDSVEAVRVGGTNLHPLLTLVSDQRVLRLPMEPLVARWAKQQIERHLRLMYAKESKRLASPGQAE